MATTWGRRQNPKLTTAVVLKTGGRCKGAWAGGKPIKIGPILDLDKPGCVAHHGIGKISTPQNGKGDDESGNWKNPVALTNTQCTRNTNSR